jgi:hypothetical protein
METLIPNFDYDDETDLLCAVALGVAHVKELAEYNTYWVQRAERFETILSKLQSEVGNFHRSK